MDNVTVLEMTIFSVEVLIDISVNGWRKHNKFKIYSFIYSYWLFYSHI